MYKRQVIDPLAGSYYIEKLTDQIESETMDYIDRIETFGGALSGIEQGFQQREIQESAYQLQSQAESKERIVVGVNEFVTEDIETPPILKVDPAVEKSRAEHLKKLRSGRNSKATEDILKRIRSAANSNENMMPLLIQAAEHYVTVGEICRILREEWGEYREVMTL